jgi:glycerol-3-phosphate dehydrogenase
MQRDVDALTGRTFDVLVVGGGVYGLTIAYDAAQRGLSVALAERADFGSGASFNHLRTIHGGLRFLQTLDMARGGLSRPLRLTQFGPFRSRCRFIDRSRGGSPRCGRASCWTALSPSIATAR